MNTEFKYNKPQAFSKSVKITAEIFLRWLHRLMDQFRNIDKSLPNGRILSKHRISDPLYQSSIKDKEELI